MGLTAVGGGTDDYFDDLFLNLGGGWFAVDWLNASILPRVDSNLLTVSVLFSFSVGRR